MATSGTVGTVLYPIRKIMDSAFRRAGYDTQKIASEGIAIALDLLYTLTAALVNAGFPLWTRQYLLLGITRGSPDVTFPVGTVDVLQAYWRSFNPYRGVCTLSSGASNTSLFSAGDASDVPVSGPSSLVTVNFGSLAILDTVGVLPGGVATVTTSLLVQTSTDGVSWTTSQTLPSTAFAPGEWSYFDLNPSVTSQYVRLYFQDAGTFTLNHLNFGLANGIDTPLGVQNIDDYFTLPNKSQQANRPTVAYLDRQVSAGIDNPTLKIWGVPDSTAFYAGTVTALTRRYIQDPGTMRDDLEVPRRWLEAIQWSLAESIINEIPLPVLLGEGVEITQIRLQERKQKQELCERKAKESRAFAWSEERTKGPIRLTPNIGPYTR